MPFQPLEKSVAFSYTSSSPLVNGVIINPHENLPEKAGKPRFQI
jgi:hypothetical protein